jgi:hypothetical protein
MLLMPPVSAGDLLRIYHNARRFMGRSPPFDAAPFAADTDGDFWDIEAGAEQ